jgi:hypothetical protein
VIHFTPSGDLPRIPAMFIYHHKKCQIWFENLIFDCKKELPVKEWIHFEISQTLIVDKAGNRVEEG